MFKFFITLLWCAVFSSAAQACTCSVSPPTTYSLRSAKDIFIFRLVSAGLSAEKASDSSDYEIVGKIEVVDRLRGARLKFKEVRFSTNRCCGIRLDVGAYFVAFFDAKGINFFGNIGNIIEIGQGDSLETARSTILAVLEGSKNLEDAFPRSQLDRIEQSPVLPPCPRK